MTREEWLQTLEKGFRVLVLETPLDDGRLGRVVHRSAHVLTVEVDSSAGKRTIEYRTSDGLAFLLGGMTHPSVRIDPAQLSFKVKKELYLEVHFPGKELAHFYVVRGPEHSQALSGPYLLDDEVDFAAVFPIERKDWIKHQEGKSIARALKPNKELRRTLERSNKEKVAQFIAQKRKKEASS